MKTRPRSTKTTKPPTKQELLRAYPTCSCPKCSPTCLPNGGTARVTPPCSWACTSTATKSIAWCDSTPNFASCKYVDRGPPDAQDLLAEQQQQQDEANDETNEVALDVDEAVNPSAKPGIANRLSQDIGFFSKKSVFSIKKIKEISLNNKNVKTNR